LTNIFYKTMFSIVIIGISNIFRLCYEIYLDTRYVEKLKKGNDEYCKAHNKRPKRYLFYLFLSVLIFFMFFFLPPINFR